MLELKALKALAWAANIEKQQIFTNSKGKDYAVKSVKVVRNVDDVYFIYVQYMALDLEDDAPVLTCEFDTALLDRLDACATDGERRAIDTKAAMFYVDINVIKNDGAFDEKYYTFSSYEGVLLIEEDEIDRYNRCCDAAGIQESLEESRNQLEKGNNQYAAAALRFALKEFSDFVKYSQSPLGDFDFAEANFGNREIEVEYEAEQPIGKREIRRTIKGYWIE